MIPQTPWFERKFDFNFPVGLFPVVMERFRGTVVRIEAITKNKTDDELTQKIEGAWSAKEQVGHLCDLEELWYGRIEDFLSGKQILRAADLNNTRTHEANHNQKNMQQLISKFSSARNQLIQKVENINEATAAVTALHPRLQTPMRLIDSLFFVAEHDDHHLAKIRELFETVQSKLHDRTDSLDRKKI
jgi:uncharacterized damage-inducible protein DinB